ncbi:MAG: CDP-glycerol glycerophosphotransferase family protein [Akkermansiaceae bacterium]
MIGILRKFSELIYRLSPKWEHAVIWGWPDYEDSVIALERALQKSRIRRVILLMSDPKTPPTWELGGKTIRVRKNSVAGWLWFCFARYVFFTHPCFTRNFPENVVSVNVWHGMPIKKIGWMIEDDPGTSCRFTLATSPFWAEIMEHAMRPQGDVLSSGLPRNDRLFCDRSKVFEKLGLDDDRKLLAWLPTYRKSVRGLPRTDGVEAGNVFEMPDVDPEQLNSFLKSHNAVLLVKPHPMAAFDGSATWSNLLIVDDAWLRERSLSLYELLGATDLLISDISSVVIDYLLLDRPIIHAFADRGAFESSRGFTVESIDDWFAGSVVTNLQELQEALEAVFSGHDPEATKRRKILKLSHAHQDGAATRRLLEAIGLRPR